MTSENSAPRHRHSIAALDGLRGLAILLVIPHNADIFSHSSPWLWPLALIAHAGWLGVQLFFVLSGFLITRNLLDSRSASNYFNAFYARRSLRIFPLYFLTLFCAFVLLPRLIELPATTLASQRNQVWLWTFLSNWAQPFGREVGGFSHFWSLAVEEQFYLLWPLVILFFAGRQLLCICAGLVVIAFACRLLLLHTGGSPEMVYMFTVCRMDALALGAVVAILEHSRSYDRWLDTHPILLLSLAATLLIAIGVMSHSFAPYDTAIFSIGYPAISCAFALVILAVLSFQRHEPTNIFNRALSNRVLRSCGKVSFAMYIFHMPILIVMGATIKRALAFTGAALPLFYAIATIILSYLAGLLSYHLVEKHFLSLKRRFVPRFDAAAQNSSAPNAAN